MASSALVAPTLYSDFRVNLATHPVTEDVLIQNNVDVVIQSIKNIVFTRPGERHRNPEFGAGVMALLFEPITPITSDRILNAITNAIKNFEPRCNLLEVKVNVLPDQNAYTATITFSVMNLERPVQFAMFLNRVR